jgi:dinuclear metal center YbgI/SA1388 family protein
MKINEIIQKIEEKFPLWIQEEYDNTGSQIVFPDDSIKGIYICLDADTITIEDAIANDCNLIISHHPLIFRPVNKINNHESRSKAIIRLIEKKITLYSIHTNFDKIMYSYLSDISGFGKGKLLLQNGVLNDKNIGYGSIVNLKRATTMFKVLKQIKKNLDLDMLIFSGDIKKSIKTIVFINGSGGSSMEKIIKSIRPDCIVTGDVGYHNAKYAIDNDVCVIDAGHFGTENIFKKLLAESVNTIISVRKNRPEIKISDVEKNPFKIYRDHE